MASWPDWPFLKLQHNFSPFSEQILKTAIFNRIAAARASKCLEPAAEVEANIPSLKASVEWVAPAGRVAHVFRGARVCYLRVYLILNGLLISRKY